MRAPVGIPSVLVLALVASGAVGCGAASPGVVPDAAARSDAAVVHLSSECTGVLVGPRHVLTAAHCVEEPGPWSVRVGRRRVRVDACAVHPAAYGARRDCGAGPGRSAAAHDLAVLRLAGPIEGVRPLEVLLTEPTLRAEWWRGRRVRIVGWDRRPRIVGPLARRSGPNHILTAPTAAFVTRPVGARGFASVVGDSGAPALLAIGGDERVVGILFGGTAPGAPESVWASTLEPANARWLLAALGEGFAADLAHLDPEDPWDRADWTELALKLRGELETGRSVRTVHP